MIVGLVGRGVTNPRRWSGTPVGVAEGLRQAGAGVEPVEAAPRRPVRWLCRAVLRARGALDDCWIQSPEMIRASQLTVAARTRRGRGRVQGWILLGAEVGVPGPAPLVTYDDMTVAQVAGLPSFHLAAMSARTRQHWQHRQQQLYERARACCVGSEWAKRSVVADYGIDPARVHVVGFGANLLTGPPPGRDWTVPHYLFVGTDWERKNGERVLAAFARLRDEQPGATLDVVGRHPRFDVEGAVGHGPLDQADPAQRARLEGLFARSTCFVMPSLAEPFGIVHVEAGRAGLPSIATTVGGAGEIAGAGGVAVDPMDEVAIVEAMRRLSDGPTAQRLGRLAQDRAALYTWEKVGRRLLHALGVATAGGGDPVTFL